MPKFCPKCGKSLKPGVTFCHACGAKIKTRAVVAVPVPPASAPAGASAGKKGGGCGTGCLIGCLIAALVALLILAGLIGTGYYFLSRMKKGEPGEYFDIDAKSKKEKTIKCGDSLTCLEDNLKKCAPAKAKQI